MHFAPQLLYQNEQANILQGKRSPENSTIKILQYLIQLIWFT